MSSREVHDRVLAERIQLEEAQAAGLGRTLATYTRLSGPGWLQSAITLGGGSLAGSLYLGVIGGYEFLWLQPLMMILGIVMLSAIAYVTLSTGQRPFQAMNEHVSPVLGWGWLHSRNDGESCMGNAAVFSRDGSTSAEFISTISFRRLGKNHLRCRSVFACCSCSLVL
jgi:hypothetical protein